MAAAFAEDLPDLTGVAVFGPDEFTSAVLVTKKPGVLAGMPAFAAAFEFLDPRCTVESSCGDGDAVVAGEAEQVVHTFRDRFNSSQSFSVWSA